MSEAAAEEANRGLVRDGPEHWTDLGGGVGWLQVEDLSCTITWKWEVLQNQSKGELKYLWERPLSEGNREIGRWAESWEVRSPQPPNLYTFLRIKEPNQVFPQWGGSSMEGR